ncbi:MAG: DNA-binding transcriptional regulator [Pirellulales bacterium]|nr:DNA-binding transcriptional regulator [Pirellulales bacterium]
MPNSQADHNRLLTNRSPRIALLVESSRAHGRILLLGVAAYARRRGGWLLHHQERVLGDAADWLKQWRGDGIIARIENRRLLEQIQAKKLPTVDLLGLHAIEGIPIVRSDDRAVARLALNHLWASGLEHFAFCGFAGVVYSDLRGKGFVEELRLRGRDAHVYLGPATRRGTLTSSIEMKNLLHIKELRAWVRSLPKPVGIMTCNDLRAQQLLNACETSGIAVPTEVSIVSVDNDEVVCALCSPTLTSIDLGAQKIGFEAAALLARQMDGNETVPERVLIPPRGIVRRETALGRKIGDPDVAAAVQLIREHACAGIRVHDVARAVELSYSTLVRRFTKELGYTPKMEIAREQIRRIKEFLGTSNMSLSDIAEATGFDHVESMCRVFKNKTGKTPGEFRRAATAFGWDGTTEDAETEFA